MQAVYNVIAYKDKPRLRTALEMLRATQEIEHRLQDVSQFSQLSFIMSYEIWKSNDYFYFISFFLLASIGSCSIFLMFFSLVPRIEIRKSGVI